MRVIVALLALVATLVGCGPATYTIEVYQPQFAYQVHRGGLALLWVQTTPGLTCLMWLKVDGQNVPNPGRIDATPPGYQGPFLEPTIAIPQTANNKGSCSWTWHVPIDARLTTWTAHYVATRGDGTEAVAEQAITIVP